jgi:hypothetical protein
LAGPTLFEEIATGAGANMVLLAQEMRLGMLNNFGRDEYIRQAAEIKIAIFPLVELKIADLCKSPYLTH